ncbi:DEAD/DEAH box helicase family protein [Clostridium tyrobutyricum]|uniref:DEAD/DEAH box helicase family protein n=1 Tax=Clostridium tyrobutyricum TaxID=1519 RepID=UPI0002FEBFAC|nr:DEAD/DEAH box helicase family protein [Clostridium tyrobutyricum]MBV4417485.1 DEAD/DEAH box helicase family protein [Clostridium tyrobutyricum]
MSKRLYEKLLDRDQIRLDNETYEIPNYIKDNLMYKLRPYQEESIRYFNYTQKSKNADIVYNHLLFNMATGSGKTLIMASIILYMYKEFKYNNFIFFVNSDAIVTKTIENLINDSSSKHLFNPKGIIIDNQHISIEKVDLFPSLPANHTIYIKLVTIQKLHDELNFPKENTLTLELLQDKKIVLIGDEAHHFNTMTKKKLSNKEKEFRSWEQTVDDLLNINNRNRLFEFTATIDMSNENIANKYKDKIVYSYNLKQFMKDGYSKKVVLLRNNEEDNNRILDAILLSQFRKYVALDNNIYLKPVILFKSNKIAISKETENDFIEMIKKLNADYLKKYIEEKNKLVIDRTSIWYKVFRYYLKNNNFNKIIKDLKYDFAEKSILNANEKSLLSVDNAVLLNSLEDIDNPIRVIFAVAKLNEGWDVLNLYDIVRIEKQSVYTRNSTDSEAQLIGRGARYYPYMYKGQKSYKRRFDDPRSKLCVLEELYYHTVNESTYLSNLKKSMDAVDLEVSDDGYQVYRANVKKEFLRSQAYKNGKFYINQRITTKLEDYQSLKSYGIKKERDIEFNSSIFEETYGNKNVIESGSIRHTERLHINDYNIYVRKAMQRNSFFHFNNLKKYLPFLKSTSEFIKSRKYLGESILNISLPDYQSLFKLSPIDKLYIVENFINYIEDMLRRNFRKERGTRIFYPEPISKYVKDYVVPVKNTSNKFISEKVISKPTRGKSWYVYDNAIADGLEHDLIEMMGGFIKSLYKKYEIVYLIRNEKQLNITEFDGVRGFMPDFILYMKDEIFTYQVFIEAKGEQLIFQDIWKKDFLEEISHDKLKIIGENKFVKLYGIKFFTKNNRSKFVKDLEKKIFDGKSLDSEVELLKYKDTI